MENNQKSIPFTCRPLCSERPGCLAGGQWLDGSVDESSWGRTRELKKPDPLLDLGWIDANIAADGDRVKDGNVNEGASATLDRAAASARARTVFS